MDFWDIPVESDQNFDIDQFITDVSDSIPGLDDVIKSASPHTGPNTLDLLSNVSPGSSSYAESISGSESSGPNSDGQLSCHVCGGEAGKHSHYGGQVCNSCRAFFRRAVQGGKTGRFTCKEQGACTIEPKSWKSCKFCRLKKCLDIGMKPNWVLNEGERAVRMQKRTPREMNVSIPLPRISELWTLDDEIHFASTWRNMIQVTNNELFDLYLRNPAFLEANARVFAGEPITNRTFALEMDNFTFGSVGGFFLKQIIPKAIPETDFAKLLKVNAPTVCEIYESSMLVHLEDGVQDMSDFLTQLERRNSEKNDVQEVIDRFAEVSLSRDGEIKPVDYRVLHSDTLEVEDRGQHMAKSRRIRNIARLDPEGRTDIITIFLVSALVMLSTHEVGLVESEEISRLQEHYGVLLLRYLKSKFGSRGTRKYCEIINTLPTAHELGRMRMAKMERMMSEAR